MTFLTDCRTTLLPNGPRLSGYLKVVRIPEGCHRFVIVYLKVAIRLLEGCHYGCHSGRHKVANETKMVS